jgi:hypothetical protein
VRSREAINDRKSGCLKSAILSLPASQNFVSVILKSVKELLNATGAPVASSRAGRRYWQLAGGMQSEFSWSVNDPDPADGDALVIPGRFR